MLTQEQLAESCDLSTAHIGHIERGSRALSIESLLSIALKLNVSTDYLLLGVSSVGGYKKEMLSSALSNLSEKDLDKLFPIFKLLVENVDSL